MSVLHHEGCICDKCMLARTASRKVEEQQRSADPRFEKHRTDGNRWWPTMSIAFFNIPAGPVMRATLHQLWESGRGEKEWRQVAQLSTLRDDKYPIRCPIL